MSDVNVLAVEFHIIGPEAEETWRP